MRYFWSVLRLFEASSWKCDLLSFLLAPATTESGRTEEVRHPTPCGCWPNEMRAVRPDALCKLNRWMPTQCAAPMWWDGLAVKGIQVDAVRDSDWFIINWWRLRNLRYAAADVCLLVQHALFCVDQTMHLKESIETETTSKCRRKICSLRVAWQQAVVSVVSLLVDSLPRLSLISDRGTPTRLSHVKPVYFRPRPWESDLPCTRPWI